MPRTPSLLGDQFMIASKAHQRTRASDLYILLLKVSHRDGQKGVRQSTPTTMKREDRRDANIWNDVYEFGRTKKMTDPL